MESRRRQTLVTSVPRLPRLRFTGVGADILSVNGYIFTFQMIGYADSKMVSLYERRSVLYIFVEIK